MPYWICSGENAIEPGLAAEKPDEVVCNDMLPVDALDGGAPFQEFLSVLAEGRIGRGANAVLIVDELGAQPGLVAFCLGAGRAADPTAGFAFELESVIPPWIRP